ncbi:MAG: hypothetical protein M3350_08765 [Actinomycetota bacterium]|nr:hypothetical protein [Actinomycetota bacterium]
MRLFVEEVRARPPQGEATATSSLAAAMAEPEVAIRRDGDEPVLGHGPVAVTDNLTLLYSAATCTRRRPPRPSAPPCRACRSGW